MEEKKIDCAQNTKLVTQFWQLIQRFGMRVLVAGMWMRALGGGRRQNADDVSLNAEDKESFG